MSNDQTKPTAAERLIEATLLAWTKYLPDPKEKIFFGGEEVTVRHVTQLLREELGRHAVARERELHFHAAVHERNAKLKEDRQVCERSLKSADFWPRTTGSG